VLISTTSAARTTKKAGVKQLVTGLFFVKKMYRDLLTGYDTRVRPVQNQSKPVYVNTKFVPMALIDFDNANQKLSMLAYIRIRWVDEQLIWKPKRYAMRDSLRASLHELWTPNVVLNKVNCHVRSRCKTLCAGYHFCKKVFYSVKNCSELDSFGSSTSPGYL